MTPHTRVLVIDDSSTLRKVVEIAMRGSAYEVDFAASGASGVARARACRPDVILLDYHLPDLPSAGVCERLRDDATTSEIPVVIMSARQREVLDDFRALPAVVGFLGKPFTPAEVRSRLETALETARGSAIGAQPPARAASQASQASGVPGGLELRGELTGAGVLDVLRLLVAARATGTLVVEHAATARIVLRMGEIVMGSSSGVAWDALAGSLGGALPPALRARATRNLADGKPVLVSLAEAGAVEAASLPLELRAASMQVIAELVDLRAGRFTWEPAAALPEFVEAFGRPVSLTTIALAHARRTAAAASAVDACDRTYDRTLRFSAKLAGAALDSDEQRVLGLVDGHSSGRDIAGRARLAVDHVAAILSRLCAADLIRDSERPAARARTLAVFDADRDGFIAPLRARLARLARPIDVIEIDPAHPVAAAVLAARCDALLIGVAGLTRSVVDHELPALARDGRVAVLGVLEAANAARANQLLRTGLHAVIAKPVHLNELERLLSA